MSRETLPNRRRGEVFSFDHEGIRYRSTISRFPDGRLAEVFLDGGKPGAAGAAVVAHDVAVAASLALQFGCPADTLRRALLRLSNGSAAGPLGRLLDLAEEGRP
jgi:ribonucleoside-diphosphate reductase alpha chain